MPGSLLLYFKGMRIMMFQLFGYYYMPTLHSMCALASTSARLSLRSAFLLVCRAGLPNFTVCSMGPRTRRIERTAVSTIYSRQGFEFRVRGFCGRILGPQPQGSKYLIIIYSPEY